MGQFTLAAVSETSARAVTNATVAQMVKGLQGNEITLKYQGGRKEDRRRARDGDRDLRSR
jgi:hypothetical protein